jgi:hypothetical protein
MAEAIGAVITLGGVAPQAQNKIQKRVERPNIRTGYSPLSASGRWLRDLHGKGLATDFITGKVVCEMRIAQVARLFESVPPRLYGGTERVVSAHRPSCRTARHIRFNNDEESPIGQTWR